MSQSFSSIPGPQRPLISIAAPQKHRSGHNECPLLNNEEQLFFTYRYMKADPLRPYPLDRWVHIFAGFLQKRKFNNVFALMQTIPSQNRERLPTIQPMSADNSRSPAGRLLLLTPGHPILFPELSLAVIYIQACLCRQDPEQLEQRPHGTTAVLVHRRMFCLIMQHAPSAIVFYYPYP